MTRDRPKRIIIRFPNWVGDVVMAMPALETMRRSFPRAHVAVALKAHLAAIVEGSPWFDSLIYLSPAATGPKTILQGASAVRKGHYDLGIALPDSFSSALLLWLGGIPRRVGYAGQARGWLLTDALPRRTRPRNMVERYLGLCGYLGLEPAGTRPRLFPTSGDEAEAERLFSKHQLTNGKVIGLAPGASFGPAKLWRNDFWVETADRLSAELASKVILIGAPGEKSLLAGIAEGTKCAAVNVAAEAASLGTLKAVVRRCLMLVTTDAGPRHYAVAFDRPVVVLMGPNDPAVTAINLERQKVLRAEADCSPCRTKVCPTDHRCMELITPDMVCQAARQLLSGSD